MIRRRKIAGRYLKASVFCFGLHAASVLLEPFAFQLGGGWYYESWLSGRYNILARLAWRYPLFLAGMAYDAPEHGISGAEKEDAAGDSGIFQNKRREAD